MKKINKVATTSLVSRGAVVLNKFFNLTASQQTKVGLTALATMGASSLVTISFLIPIPEEVNELDVVEQQRVIAQENSKVNARLFQQAHKQFYKSYISTDVDFSINSKCANGDGWANVELIDEMDGKVVAELMCSTISKSLGCELKTEFNARDYAIQEGTCNLGIPVPMPTLSIY